MDTKNVIAAISLSAAVIILYSLFFAPSPEEMKQNKIKQEQVQKDSDKHLKELEELQESQYEI